MRTAGATVDEEPDGHSSDYSSDEEGSESYASDKDEFVTDDDNDESDPTFSSQVTASGSFHMKLRSTSHTFQQLTSMSLT